MSFVNLSPVPVPAFGQILTLVNSALPTKKLNIQCIFLNSTRSIQPSVLFQYQEAESKGHVRSDCYRGISLPVWIF